MIAGVLNRNGLTTGNGNRWTRERVTALRSYRKIPVFRPQIDGVEPWLNLGGAAKLLGNTVVVVEHDMRAIAQADWIIDLGPGAGEDGSRIVASGVPSVVAEAEGSLTARYLKAAL